MNLLTRLRFSLARGLAKAAGLTWMPQYIRASFLQPTFEALVREGYEKNAVVASCITALAFTFPEPPLLVYASEDADAPPVPKHPLRLLLRRPNALMGEDELWAYTIAYMAIGGNAYWVCPLNGGGRPVEIWPYHAGQVRPVPGGPQWVHGYEFLNASGAWEAIKPQEFLVCHFKWPLPDPNQPWMAQPPLKAASRAVDTDSELDRYLYALLKNDAMPRTIISQNKDRFMDDDEVKRAKAQFKSEYGGDNAGGVLILEAGATVTRLSMNLEELAFDALRGVPEKRIAAVLRVPLSVAGIGDDPTYANSEEAYNRYTRSTLVPLWRAAAAEVESALGSAFGGVVCRHDLSQVAALQEDVNARWLRVTTAMTAGLLDRTEARAQLGFTTVVVEGQVEAVKSTPILGYHIETGVVSRNEARAQLGLAPEDESLDERLRRLQSLLSVAQAAVNVGYDTSAALQLVGLEAPPPLALPPPAEDGKALQVKAAAPRTARALQRIRNEVAGRMEAAIEDAFTALAERVAERAQESAKALPTVASLLLKTDEDAFKALFKEWTVVLVRASWETWNTQLDVDLAFDRSDPAVVKALAQSGARVKDILDYTRDALKQVLQTGAAEGWSIEQLVSGVGENAGIRDVVAETYRGRARTIARSETAMAQQACTVARYRAAGVAKVRVLDNGFDDSDPKCTELNGTIQTLAWAEANPIQHPNCVRSFAPAFED